MRGRRQAATADAGRADADKTALGDDERVGSDPGAVAQARHGRSAERNARGQRAEASARADHLDDLRGPDRLGGTGREHSRPKADVGCAPEDPPQRNPVAALQVALETRARREPAGAVPCSLELVLVRAQDGAEARLETHVHAPRLASAGDGVQPPGRRAQGEQRDEQEIRDEFELETHMTP